MLQSLRSFGHIRAADDDSNRVTAVISTGDLARDGAVILTDGWDFTNYQKNPVVLFAHGDTAMPVGRTVDGPTVKGNEVVATAELDDQDPMAMGLLGKIKRGLINATSVRWQPRKTEVRVVEVDGEEREVLHFVEQELLEWSFVPLPADPGAAIVRAADGQPVDLRELCQDCEQDRGAIASHDTDTIDQPWNGPAAVAGAPNSARVLRYMHAWVESGADADVKRSYKFAHHAPRVGSPANCNGVGNGLARFREGCEARDTDNTDLIARWQERADHLVAISDDTLTAAQRAELTDLDWRLSGANIPAADRPGVERHLRRHLTACQEAAAKAKGNGYSRAEIMDEVDYLLSMLTAQGTALGGRLTPPEVAALRDLGLHIDGLTSEPKPPQPDRGANTALEREVARELERLNRSLAGALDVNEMVAQSLAKATGRDPSEFRGKS